MKKSTLRTRARKPNERIGRQTAQALLGAMRIPLARGQRAKQLNYQVDLMLGNAAMLMHTPELFCSRATRTNEEIVSTEHRPGVNQI